MLSTHSGRLSATTALSSSFGRLNPFGRKGSSNGRTSADAPAQGNGQQPQGQAGTPCACRAQGSGPSFHRCRQLLTLVLDGSTGAAQPGTGACRQGQGHAPVLHMQLHRLLQLSCAAVMHPSQPSAARTAAAAAAGPLMAGVRRQVARTSPSRATSTARLPGSCSPPARPTWPTSTARCSPTLCTAPQAPPLGGAHAMLLRQRI